MPRFLRPACLLALLLPVVALADSPPVIENDIVYGHKDGMALIFDVMRPATPNGAAVLFLQSAGWYSAWKNSKDLLPTCQPFLDKGFTVFTVWHGSAPKYTVPEAAADVQRAVRFIHANASRWQIDATRLGVFGGSAGGHLTLMLATTGDDGKPESGDFIMRQSSRIAAAVALYPPTDLRNWTSNPPEEIKKVAGLKPPLTFDAALEASVSPILHVDAKDAPTLLIHGDQDKLVTPDNSEKMITELKDKQVPSDILIIKNAGHGFNAEENKVVVPAMVDWFVKYLTKTSPR